MSRTVATLVYSKQVGSMARKAVLAYFADRANDDGSGIWASKQRIADEIECSKQTVITVVKALCSDGILKECGHHKTQGGYTVIYGINLDAVAALPDSKKDDEPVQNLTSPEFDQSTSLTPTSQTALPKPSLNRPISSEAKASSEKRARKSEHPFECPQGVDPIDWEGLKANRKTKRAALHEGAYRQIVNKLEVWKRDGWPPGPIVAHAAEMGWTSVFPTDEMKAKQNGNRTNAVAGYKPDQQTDGLGRTGRAAMAVLERIRANGVH